MGSRSTTIFALTLGSILFFACDKYKAKKLAGDYDCTVQVSSFNMNSGFYDTVKQEVINIGRNGKNLIILGREIHVDSLRNSHRYVEGNVSAGFLFWVYFSEDSLYAETWGGGLGGNGSCTYKGRKI